MAAEEGAAPEAVVALRAELGLCKSERDALREELKDLKVREQLLLTRVAELEAKYEVRAPARVLPLRNGPVLVSSPVCPTLVPKPSQLAHRS